MVQDYRSARRAPRLGEGCLGGGLQLLAMLLAIPLLALIISAAFYFRIPQQLGLWQSPAQRLLSGTPHREASAAMWRELVGTELDAKGVELYVLPIAGQEANLGVLVLDASRGFKLQPGHRRDFLLDCLIYLAETSAAQQYAIERLVIDYRGLGGASVMTLTAPTEEVRAFATKQIERNTFLQAIEGRVGWPALMEEILQ